MIATVALALLLALTAASFLVAEGQAGPWPIAGLAITKAAIIGAVFLEMDRSWPGWAVGALVLVTCIAGGAAALVSW